MSALHLNVEANNSYDIFLRYKFQPENINHYTIKVKPHWWQTNRFWFTTGFSTFLLIVFIVFFVFKKREQLVLQKNEAERKQAQLGLKSIYAQLNPHFIFNALNSIQGLINKSDIANANLYLSEFSNLLRESLKNNDKEFVPLNTELKTLETYIKLEQLRFRFNYTFSVDYNLNTNAVELPSLLLQPLIENAIKHGVSALYENGFIVINFYARDKNLLIDIIDNGKGFDTTVATDGFGLKLTNERIQLLNQSIKKQQISLSIESNNTVGTTVHLIFENWL